MNHRITLLKRADGVDAIGQPSKEWTAIASIWADVMFPTGAAILRSGGELIRAGAEASVVKVSIRIRARADVTQGMRAIYGNWTFHVLAVTPDTDRQFAFLVCEAIK